MTIKIATAKERLKQYLDYKGITNSRFYNETGLNRGLLDADKLSQSISSDKTAIIIARYRDLNLYWLITGEGTMLKDESKQYDFSSEKSTTVNSPEITPIHRSKSVEKIIDKQFIPLYSFEATAGVLEHIEDSSQYEMEEILIPGLSKCDGAVRITGDSMYPLLKSGDIVIYKEVVGKEFIFFGEMYLLSIKMDFDNYITVKYVQRSEKGEQYVKLVSYNTHHSPVDMPLSAIRTMAIIKASVRFNTM